MTQAAPRSSSFICFGRSDLEQSITARFEKIVTLYPDRPAVKGRTTELTYSELNRSANRVASTLLDRCGPAAGGVGLLVQEECKAVVAILGVLKAREFYVPLDARFPRDRLRSIVEDCELR